MIARIIPLLRLPRSLGVFDYLIKSGQQLQVGSAVVVPYRGRKTVGIVEAIATNSPIPLAKLKEILAVISNEQLVLPEQKTVATFLCQESFVSPATMMRSLLPKLELREVLDLPELEKRSPLPASTNLTGIGDRQIGVLTYRTWSAKIHWLQATVAAVQATGRNVLLLSPTKNEVAQISKNLPNVSPFPAGTGDAAFRKSYLRLRRHPASIIGTRSAVFAPLQNLGLIVIDDEEADEFIQDEPNPRYDTRAVALLLSRIHNSRLVFLTRLPTLVTLNSFGPIHALEPNPVSHWSFTDLDEARRGGNYDLLPEPTIKTITACVQAAGRVLVIHSRAALFGSLECSDCGQVVNCPTCQVPYRLGQDRLTCGHCGNSLNIPLRCPRCRSVRLKGKGRGIEHVVQELTGHQLPASRSDSARPGLVLVKTPAEIRAMQQSSFDLIVITRYESLLAVPRSDAEERARRLLVELDAMLTPNGQLLIQGSPRAKNVMSQTYNGTWRDDQKKSTERFGYPPAWHLLQLRRRNDASVRSALATTVMRDLQKLDPALIIAGPFRSQARSPQDRGGIRLVLRYHKRLTDEVRKFLSQLDEGWSIVIDPRELS